MVYKQTSLLLLFITVTGLFLLSSCSDSVSSSEENEPEIVGFVLQVDGVDIVSYQNGSYSFNSAPSVAEYVRDNTFVLSTTHNGGNLVRTSAEEEEPSGRRYFTVPLGVQFIMSTGETVELPQERVPGASGDVSGDELNPDGPFRLNVEWTDAPGDRSANIEQHGSDQSWRFHVRADYLGTAFMTVAIDRCDDVISLDSISGENTRVDQVRNCAISEERVFETSIPLQVVVDDYEFVDEDGKFPHVRHERLR